MQKEVLKNEQNRVQIFSQLKNLIINTCDNFPDKRTGKNKQYSMKDIGMGAFSIFFTQSPSFLSHQMRLKSAKGRSNAETIFDMIDIPTDNHIRNILDSVSPDNLELVYDKANQIFKQTALSELYEGINGTKLLALDATWYFSSDNIYCENCSTMKKDDKILNYHSAITPVIVAPDQNKAIPQCPEFITPQDGHKKQDCEINAGKRWLEKHGHKYALEKVTILGDDLYSKDPFCKLLQGKGFHFILVCKPTSHKTLADWISTLDEHGDLSSYNIKRRIKNKNKIYSYKYTNGVPLCDKDDSIIVNWCELVILDENGKKLSNKSFITDHKITEKNVESIVESGRCRWKIENENNNTLKTKGYHLKHNFGHGKKHLSSLLASMNILAFFFHTILDVMDSKYSELRAKLPTRKMFFEHIRALTCYSVFKNWGKLLDFMLDGLEKKHDLNNFSSYCN